MDKPRDTSENAAVDGSSADAASALGDLLHRLRLPESRRKPPPQSLTAAAVDDDLEMVAAFLDAGADAEERSIGFASPLQAAAGAGRLAAVELLLARGADPRQKPEASAIYSPLSAAAMHGHFEVVRRLAEAIGDLSAETRAAPHAATHGRLDTLEFLLDRGAPLGANAGHVLRVAAWGGRFGCVKRLLAEGIDPRHHPDYDRDLFGEPVDEPYLPRQAALDNGHTAVAALLDGLAVNEAAARRQEAKREDSPAALARLAQALGRSGEARESEPPALEGAEREQAAAKALAILRDVSGEALAGLRAGGRPLLVAAAEGGHATIVDALLGAGADPGAVADDGDTALIAASRWGHLDVVSRLLARGVDVEARNGERMTALMAAAGRGDLACVRVLLEAGADPDARVRGRSASGFAYGVRRPAIRALVAEYAARRANR